MSIYALPGPLYKLISAGVTKSSKADAEHACASKDTIGSCSVSSSSAAPACPAGTPLSRRLSSSSASSIGSQLEPSDNDSSSERPLSGGSSSISTAGRNSSGGSNNNNNGHVCKLAVKEAKIDTARFIRSLSKKPEPKKAPSETASTERSSDNDASTNSSSSLSVGSGSTRRRRSKKSDDSSPDSSSERKCDPHEDAINFEISVSFNGREYTATRTLPRILQFRYDLIEEFRTRRVWRERRRKRNKSKPPRMAKLHNLSDDDEDDDDSIPELPRLSEDAAGGSGFAMLNALLRPYGPALEGWLHSIIDIVPHDSQCLTQFLWEPLAGQVTNNATSTSKSTSGISSRGKARRGSYQQRRRSSLGAIQESTSDLGYDSDTDNYLLNH